MRRNMTKVVDCGILWVDIAKANNSLFAPVSFRDGFFIIENLTKPRERD